jgi:hypothetical protein
VKRHLLPKQLPHPLPSNSLIAEDDNDDDTEDFPDLHIAYRRPDLEKCSDKCQHDEDDELSDYVLVRLAVARAKAMKLYKKA